MARLACETKMGFYPTDTSTIKKIIDKTLQFPENKSLQKLRARQALDVF